MRLSFTVFCYLVLLAIAVSNTNGTYYRYYHRGHGYYASRGNYNNRYPQASRLKPLFVYIHRGPRSYLVNCAPMCLSSRTRRNNQCNYFFYKELCFFCRRIFKCGRTYRAFT